jgi:hypothetical protein
MSPGAISFIGWVVVLLGIVVGLLVAAKRSKMVQDEAEDIASKALPAIGQIAEKKHRERFGRAPTNAPGEKTSWYPEAKKKVAKASVR